MPPRAPRPSSRWIATQGPAISPRLRRGPGWRFRRSNHGRGHDTFGLGRLVLERYGSLELRVRSRITLGREQPFAPDGNEQRHENRAHEQADKPHRLYAADQSEQCGKKGQADRAANEAGTKSFVHDEQLDRSPREEGHGCERAAACNQIEGNKRDRQRCSAGNQRHETGNHSKQKCRGNAGDPIGYAEHDPLPNGDEGHTGHRGAHGRRHDAREAMPARRQRAFADAVEAVRQAWSRLGTRKTG